MVCPCALRHASCRVLSRVPYAHCTFIFTKRTAGRCRTDPQGADHRCDDGRPRRCLVPEGDQELRLAVDQHLQLLRRSCAALFRAAPPPASSAAPAPVLALPTAPRGQRRITPTVVVSAAGGASSFGADTGGLSGREVPQEVRQQFRQQEQLVLIRRERSVSRPSSASCGERQFLGRKARREAGRRHRCVLVRRLAAHTLTEVQMLFRLLLLDPKSRAEQQVGSGGKSSALLFRTGEQAVAWANRVLGQIACLGRPPDLCSLRCRSWNKSCCS